MSSTRASDIRPAAAFLRLALLSIAAMLSVAAIGYLPTKALAGGAGLVSMCLGLGIALVGTLAGLVPPLLTAGLAPPHRQSGILGGMAVRFLLTIALLTAALLSGLWAQLPLAIWAAIGYIVLLCVDVAGLLWLNRRRTRVSS